MDDEPSNSPVSDSNDPPDGGREVASTPDADGGERPAPDGAKRPAPDGGERPAPDGGQVDRVSRSQFTDVDWDSMDARGWRPDANTVAFVLGIAALVALFAWDFFVLGPKTYTINVPWPRFELFGHHVYGFLWDVRGIDWLFVASLWAMTTFLLVPAVTDEDARRRYWESFRSDPVVLGSALFLGVVFVGGLLGPILFPPEISLKQSHQPPVFFTVEKRIPIQCVGYMADRTCHGSWAFPLGTNSLGKGIGRLILTAWRVALQVGLTTTAIAIPIAVVVGTVAAYRGGIVDDLLTRYVDIQETIPAFLVYLILRFLFFQSLFLIVLVFGLLAWGGAARMVRSAVLKRNEEQYVMASESAGGSELTIAADHLLPNVSGTVFAAATRLTSRMILVETAIAFLELNDPVLTSFGQLIDNGLEGEFLKVWWMWLIPAVALILTIVSLNFLGDGLRDALDPRSEA